MSWCKDGTLRQYKPYCMRAWQKIELQYVRTDVPFTKQLYGQLIVIVTMPVGTIG